MMVMAVEGIKSTYSEKMGGSKMLGDVFGFVRNITVDAIQMCDWTKYNMQMYLSGNLTHPSKYEWEGTPMNKQ